MSNMKKEKKIIITRGKALIRVKMVQKSDKQ